MRKGWSTSTASGSLAGLGVSGVLAGGSVLAEGSATGGGDFTAPGASAGRRAFFPPRRTCDNPGVRSGWRTFLVSLALAVAVVAAFLPVGGHEFVSFDDDAYVTANPEVRGGLAPRGIAWAFTSTRAANWHPLTWLSHMLDVELFGLDAGRHHLTSLGLHLAGTLLLFSVLRAFTGALWRSAFAAALFALHPLRVESVAWVAQRKDVLALLFWLLTMGAYRRYLAAPGRGRYLAVCVLFAAGLAAKPTLVSLPLALLLLDLWPLGRLRPAPAGTPRRPSRNPAVRLLLEKAPLFLLAAAAAVVTFLAQSGSAVSSLESWPLPDRAAAALTGYAAYLGKTLWPADLAVFYPLPPEGISAAGRAAALVSLAGLAALTALLLRAWRRAPFLGFGWVWFLVTLIPVIGLVQVGTQSVADRYTLIPHIGLAVLASWGLELLVRALPRRRGALLALAALVPVALAVQTRRQVLTWRDSGTLYRHALAVTSGNWLVNYNYGMLLEEQGRRDEAAARYEEALRARPRFGPAHNNLGRILLAGGRAAEAERHFRQALELDPGLTQARNNLGVVLLRRGDAAGAARQLAEAVRLDPGYVDARFNLASALAAAGERGEAVRQFREVLRLSPGDAMARHRLEGLLGTGP